MSTLPTDTPKWAEPQGGKQGPFGRGLSLAGFGIIAVFCSAFYVWASSAPIESAVVAPGIVSVDSNVRTVQHLEGGIIDEILVREGDRVEAGQILIRLQSTGPASARNELQAQYFEVITEEARLVAEQMGLSEISFPDELTQKVGDKMLRAAMAGQQKILDNRRGLLTDRETILERTKGGLQSEIIGLEGQAEASEKRRDLISEELTDAEELYESNLISKTRMLQLRREKAEQEGEIARYRAEIGTVQQRLEEAELRFSEFKAGLAAQVTEDLQQIRARAYELGQRLAAAQDVMGRTEIQSPVAGVVTGLNVHTVGGVIDTGQPLLDIVPISDKLVVQATIDPLDIDQVTEGLFAQVWLTALNRRSEAPIEGLVTTVSADRIIDAQTGAAYYTARVELNREDARMGSVPLQPGMGVEVMIRTGARTTWDYLSAPISRFLSRGMREG